MEADHDATCATPLEDDVPLRTGHELHLHVSWRVREQLSARVQRNPPLRRTGSAGRACPLRLKAP